MRIIFLLIRELKDWIEFLIRNIPGGIGNFTRVHYYKFRLRESFENNRFEAGFRIEFPKQLSNKQKSSLLEIL